MRQSIYWLKLPYFSNQSCLWSNTLLQDQKRLLIKLTQSDRKGGNMSSPYPNECEISMRVNRVCVWAGMSFKHVFDHCMRWPELKSWKTACVGCYWQRGDGLDGQLKGKLRSRPMTDEAESGLTEGNAREFGMGGNDNGPKKEMKRIAAFGNML